MVSDLSRGLARNRSKRDFPEGLSEVATKVLSDHLPHRWRGLAEVAVRSRVICSSSEVTADVVVPRWVGIEAVVFRPSKVFIE